MKFSDEINAIGENVQIKNLQTASGDSSLVDVASKMAGTLRLESERKNAQYEYHVISLVSNKGGFVNTVQQTYANGSEDEPMIIVRTAEPSYKFDVVSSVLALKKRKGVVDEGIKANQSELEREIVAGVKMHTDENMNAREKNEKMMLLNKVLLESSGRVKGLVPELKCGFFAALTSPDVAFEIGYADTEGSNTLRFESRVATDNYNILVVTIIFPNA